MSPRAPVNPSATQPARDLLGLFYEHQGQRILSGQHNQMHHMSQPSDRIAAIAGRYPLVWGGEWGFSDERHNIDNVLYRPRLLEQIREHHARGRIIVMTYHQASPVVGEPCDFQGGVIATLSDAEWDELLSPGSALHSTWAEHVDRLAHAFAQLASEGIPVVFRPYHEMNGGWFWWGGDPDRFRALWAMIFERFTLRHRLNNLLWAWNPDKPHVGVEAYYPGHDTVDLLGTDIYPRADMETYPQEWFDRMQALADGRPLALSENSELPDPASFERQPWSYFMSWDDLVFRANADDRIRAVYADPIVLSSDA